MLLYVDHVCVKNGIQIPWDEVAKLVGGDRNLSGEARSEALQGMDEAIADLEKDAARLD